MKMRLSVLAALLLALLLCFCGCLGDTPDTPATLPPVTEPPVTNPPVTEPPVTEPPVTEPPVTEPPVTEPPVTNPPVTNPPVTEPPVTNPPVTNPPVTEPPVCMHSYQTTTTAATCTTPGSTVSRCTKCGDTKTETIPALGHNSDKKTVKDPTCTAKGTTTYSCSRCGKVMKTEEKAALGHSYGAWVVTTEATTTKEGVRTATCSVCKATKTEKIPKLSPLKALDPSEYYGYQYLGTLPNATQMQGAYRKIVAESEKQAKEIDISEFHLSPDDIGAVYMIYVLDYPQHFWVSRQGLYYTTDGFISPSYLTFEGGLDRARNTFEKAIDSLLEGISGDDSEFVREEKAHDHLVAFCEYFSTKQEIEHNAYGAVVDGKAVCEGYAKAMQCLMYRCGIQCFTVNGTIASGNHEWNIIRIGGEYYHLDPTFDDPTGTNYCSHKYFNLTTKQISEDHKIVDSMNYVSIPTCTATKYYYPMYGGVVVKELTVDALAQGMVAFYEKTGKLDTIVLYYMGDPSAVGPFLKSNAGKALTAAQKLSDAFKTVKVTSYIDPQGGAQFALLFKPV